MAKKRTSKKAEVVASTPDPEVTPSHQEKVARLAYTYWEQRGCQGGSPEEDWYRAEQEILGQQAPDSRR